MKINERGEEEKFIKQQDSWSLLGTEKRKITGKREKKATRMG